MISRSMPSILSASRQHVYILLEKDRDRFSELIG